MAENKTNVRILSRVVPMIYAYTTPGVKYHEGWIKIGYTEKQTVEDRIYDQTHTAGVHPHLEWKGNAMYADGSGEYFTDHEFHRYLTQERGVEREKDLEWFRLDSESSEKYFYEFARHNFTYSENEGYEYTLRDEQRRAVDMTRDWFEKGGKKFLWNAKPRFGKTLTAYDLICGSDYTNVLIVTQRPSVANSWADDFFKFIYWRGQYEFVSETDSIAKIPHVISRVEYYKRTKAYKNIDEAKKMIAFVSLQDLKGSNYFGGKIDKLKWISEIKFDLLIVDEAQEGVDTALTETAFNFVKRDHTLYLSGTPFKALASEKFSDDEIFNWSYVDEQEKKENWISEEYNPYEIMPKLNMYTYKMSDMIYDGLKRGVDLSGDGTVDYAFDLAEFFAVNENKKFIHEDDVKKFLHALTTQEKYPFSTPELRNELSHTLWILNRVDSAKALAKLLKEDPVFNEYEIVVAAGDGKTDDDEANEKAFNKVKTAIENHDRTITLSVGQLTVGVTIPEWSGVLMLCNLRSASSYMQAAFRAQNPYAEQRGKDGCMRKENAYIFDFDPARTLIIYDEFANNLCRDGTKNDADRQENIKRLLNFFPVIGEDSEGRMAELDAGQILSIPRKLKCQEVVRCGFMCNFLFQNISNVFGAPDVVKEIVGKLVPAHEEKPGKRIKGGLSNIGDVPVNEKGEVEVSNEIAIGLTRDVFGPKLYDAAKNRIDESLEDFNNEIDTPDAPDKDIAKIIDGLSEKTKEVFSQNVAPSLFANSNISKRAKGRIQREEEKEIDKEFRKIKDDFKVNTNILNEELKENRNEAETEADLKAAEDDFKAKFKSLFEELNNAARDAALIVIENRPENVIKKIKESEAEEKKKAVEDDVRAHLRGFTRTIPSFIMAYGDENLTLKNFDEYVDGDVFEEVTGITIDDFRFLRDGGEYYNHETGKEEHFRGRLFDETVFNDSVKEFLNKKDALSNYFDESRTEDIFDYIPPQKTNQIFTPKWVVKEMVDMLEKENPGCFDDPDKTFADLYMKSGLYITEIVKRLYRSDGLRKAFPDGKDRIEHILTRQVYGMAPTEIIYRISTNYILGFDSDIKKYSGNFVMADASKAAQEGTLDALVKEKFGNI